MERIHLVKMNGIFSRDRVIIKDDDVEIKQNDIKNGQFYIK